MNSEKSSPTDPTNGAKNDSNLSRCRKAKGLINEEYCSYCKEGGNLLNCDRCPSSFHFLCHEPPLDLDQIPKGEFLCNKCDYESKLLTQHPHLTSSESKKCADQIRDKKFQAQANNIHHNELVQFFKFDKDSSIELLIRMAKALNPSQMKICKGLKCKHDTNMPGTNRFRLYHKTPSPICNNNSKRTTSVFGVHESTLVVNGNDLDAKKTQTELLSLEVLAKNRAAEKKAELFNKKNQKICQICKK